MMCNVAVLKICCLWSRMDIYHKYVSITFSMLEYSSHHKVNKSGLEFIAI